MQANTGDAGWRASQPASGGPLAVLAVFATALALRLAYLWEASHGPFAASVYLPIDAQDYHVWAIDWLHGAWPAHEAFFRPPLYTLFVGSIYALAGPSPIAVLIVQAVLGAASCLLVHGIARDLFPDRRVATAAALLCALYGTLIYFDAQLLSANLDVFLQLLMLRLLLLASRRRGVAWWIAPGACVGVSAINRGAALLLLPVALVWLCRLPAGQADGAAERPARRWRFVALRAFALLVPVGLVILPVTWHNVRFDGATEVKTPSERLRRLAAGRFVTIASNSGINFYLGNHRVLREVNRVDHPDHFTVYDRIRSEPARKGLSSAAAANAYLVRETLRHVTAWPSEWLALMGIKLAELVNGTEIPRNTSPYADRRHSLVLSVLLWRKLLAFPTGVVIPFALVGLVLVRHAWREHLLVWGSLGVQAAFILAFFVTARYRLPMLPLLALYAAHAGLALVDRLRLERREAARLGGVLALLLALCNLEIVPVSESHHFIDHHNLGIAYAERREFEKAETHLHRAVELNPGDPRALGSLCDLLLDRERVEQALPFCSRAVEADPKSAGAQLQLGSALEQLGRVEESLPHYRRAARLAPQTSAPRQALQRARETLRRKQ